METNRRSSTRCSAIQSGRSIIFGRRFRVALWLSALAVVALSSTRALAQDGVAINQFDPAPIGDRPFGVQSPDVRGDPMFRAGLVIDYAHDPLVLKNTVTGDELGSVVSDQLWFHLGGSLALWDRLLLSLNIPFVLYQDGDDPAPGVIPAPDSPEFGDIRLGARVRLLGPDGEGFHLALGGHLWLPTGNQGSYVSDGAFRGSPFLVVGGYNDWISWSAQLGVLVRAGQTFFNTPVGTALTFGGSLEFLLDEGRTFQLGPELYGQTTVGGGGSFFAGNSTSAELLLGAKWRPGGGSWVFGLAGGPGFGSAIGSPDYRILGLIAFSPEPERDRDGDGVLDEDDACPEQAGVKTPDPTTNGCPAPPGDKDYDGVPDEEDACPTDWGEPSEDKAKNGCPRDGDEDGIPDVEDACPTEPGIRHEDPEHNGCPRARIVASDEAIVITQAVQFEHGEAVIKPESDGLLEDVADIMKKNPDIKTLEVQGHTDNTGPAHVNRRLSDARAKAVRKWLIDHGVEGGRLRAKGYGPDRPISDNDSDRGRGKNRRVEFKIIKGPGTNK